MFINKNIYVILRFIQNQANILLTTQKTKEDAQDMLSQQIQGHWGPAGVYFESGLFRPGSNLSFTDDAFQEEAGQEAKKN